MKKFYQFLFLIIIMVSCSVLRAQVRVTVSAKTNLFPSTGLSYLNNPDKYFTVFMSNMSATEEQIYIGITLKCNFTADGTSFNMSTPVNRAPLVPLTIGANQSLTLTRQHFNQLLGHLNGSDLNISGINWTDMLQLPEGQYEICVTPYKWSQNVMTPVTAGDPGCYIFNVCYSGSAPEFTMPVLGQGAGNLINTTPLNNFVGNSGGSMPLSQNSPTSDIRNSLQYTVIPLQRNLTFRWTGVISNCMTNSNFNYILKIVEVGPTQNVQDAINDNPTLATINNGSKLFYIHDTLTNRQFYLQKGHIYAARVTAVLKNSSIVNASLGNNGNSQVITFVWGQEPVDYEISLANNTTFFEKDNKAKILEQIRFPYIVNPAKDQKTIDALVAKFTSEKALVPKSMHDSLSLIDNTYYLFKKDTVLPISWMPVRSDSVIAVTYTAELFEYVGGDIQLSFNKTPLKKYTLMQTDKSKFALNNNTPLVIENENWSKCLEKGYKYVIRLTASAEYAYLKTVIKTTTEYLNGIPVNQSEDSLVGMVSSETYYSNMIFQWGIDSGALTQVKPAQFVYPVDLSHEDIETYVNNDIPEIIKDKDFKFAWTKPENISIKDSVTYNLFICKFPKGKKIEKAVKDTFLFYKNISNLDYINDTLYDSLKVNSQYVIYIETHIKTNADKYKLLNKGRSLYAVFKLIDEPEFEADLDQKFACYPSQADNLDKTVITPKVDSLVSNKVRLMMGKFPLVIQKAKLDPTKKTYTGEGYIVWSPFHGEVWLKVAIDSIQINKNLEIIKGSAKSAVQDSANYVKLDFGKGLCDFTDQTLNKLETEFANEKRVKEYYNYANKYAKPLNGLCGLYENGSLSTGVLTFPLTIDDEAIAGTKNMQLSINNMYFSPKTALMNLIAIFNAQDDNLYIPLIATNICLQQNSLLGDVVDSVSLYLGKSYDIPLNDGYVMRFKASTKLGNPKDGTYLVITDKGFKQLTMEVEFDMNDDLLGIDKKTGTAQHGKVVHANFSTTIRDWDDWYTKIYMDPFVVDGCEDYTFVPTGKGIFYDHSSSQTPKEIKFPKGYINKAQQNQWEGFYMDEFKVFLSDDISNTFTDESSKDSVVMYKYGFNNTVVDSAHYAFPGTRINFGANDLIIDKDGFSVEIFARDIFKASTQAAGGWMFSIDTISVRFEKNKYKYGRLAGSIGLPLFEGDLIYDCSIGADSLDFTIAPKDSVFKLDVFLAKIDFDTKSSYFRLRKLYDEDRTRIDLSLNGKINIDFNHIDLPVNFTLVKFEHMGLRNYNLADNAAANTAHFTDLDFDIGTWSWASPQKTIGGAASNEDGEVVGGSIGGFKYSVTTFKPFFTPDKDGYMKVGLAVAGDLGFGDETFSIGAGAGFKIWSFVHMKTYDVKGFDGELDSIHIETDLTVFSLKGAMYFMHDDPIYGDGLSGFLKVTIMDKVTVSMAAGFGTALDNNDSTYSWWFFQGAALFSPGVPLGCVNLTGLGGGFAYNMTSKESLENMDTKALLGQGFADQVVNNKGIAYTPQRRSWEAKAGVSLALANEKIMNASGILTLRMGGGHFTGIFMVVNASVMASINKDVAASEEGHNKSSLLKAVAIIGYEKYRSYHYFRLSINVEGSYSLSGILEAVTGNIPVFTDKLTENLKYVGDNIADNSRFSMPGESNAGTGNTNKNNRSFGVSASLRVPIDLEVKSYRADTIVMVGNVSKRKKKGTADWYFCIGKPNADECVKFETALSLGDIFSAEQKFTFYLMAGNSFSYALPELDPEVAKFFYGDKSGKKLTTDTNKIHKARTIKDNDKMTIAGAGGFALGATFKASMEFNFFLYVRIMAAIGMDVAMLDVHGQGCEGHTQIGKNDFYAMGRVYAMLKGSVGLRLNLGFWKGDIELLSAGIGALLEGGGPNPSWAYGLLRFKLRCLGGLIKINTSVDFSVGDVCVPGAGDPLANVKLFQNITPGLEKEADAKKEGNRISPLSIGNIVSNMPWNEDVILCDGNTSSASARKFRFVMWQGNKIETYQNSTWKVISRLKFSRNTRDANTISFETTEGGFPIESLNKITLHARAFEWRQYHKDINGKELIFKNNTADYRYNLTTFESANDKDNAFAWFNPIYAVEKKNRYETRPFKVDTTLWFQTKSLPKTLENQVIYTWPYNGDPQFPNEEYIYTEHGASNKNITIPIFLYKDRPDLFSSENIKNLKVFIMESNGEKLEKATECTSLNYSKLNDVPVLKVELPNGMKTQGGSLWKVKIISIKQEQYQAVIDSIVTAQQNNTKASYELQRTKWEQIAREHLQNSSRNKNAVTGKKQSATSPSGSNNSTGYLQSGGLTLRNPATTSRTSPTSGTPVSGNLTPASVISNTTDNSDTYYGEVDIAKGQYQQMLDDAVAQGEDTAMLYKRISINQYAICNRFGIEVYSIYYRTAYDKTYKELLERINRGRINLSLNSASFTSTDNCFTTEVSVGPNSNFQLGKWQHIFLPYTPNDKMLYHEGITLPPIAFFVIDGEQSIQTYNNEIFYRHKLFMEELAYMNLHLQNLSPISILYKHPKESNVTSINYGTGAWQAAKAVLNNGLIPDHSSSFLLADYRMRNMGNSYSSYDPATFAPKYMTNDDKLPNILCFESNCEVEHINNAYFQNGKYLNDYSTSGDFRLVDKATPAAIDDITKLYNFFQDCQGYAAYFNVRGYSYKQDYLKYYVALRNVNKSLSIDGFPYSVPALYLMTEYFTLFNWMTDQYLRNQIPSGTKDYLLTDNIPGSTNGWLKYWFRFKGVRSKMYESEGIDKNFYFWDTKPWVTLRGEWYSHIDKYANFVSGSSSVTTSAIDIYFLSGNTSFPANLLSQMATIAKKVKMCDNDAMIFETNSLFNSNWSYRCWLPTTLTTQLTKTNSLKLLKPNVDKYGIDK